MRSTLKNLPIVLPAKRIPRLSAEEERDLVRRWRESKDPKLLARLVEPLIGLVVRIAAEFRHAGPPFEDLVQEGHIGLLVAVEKFDPARGVRLSTYASFWIRARMIDYAIRTRGPVRFGTTRNERRIYFNLGRVKRRLEILGKAADSATLARELRVEVEDVERAMPRMRDHDMELDAPGEDESSLGSFSRFLACAPLAEDHAAEVEEQVYQRKALWRALADLNEKQRAVIALRFLGERKTLQEIAAKLGVSRERVRQIEVKAIEKLRVALLPAKVSRSPMSPRSRSPRSML